MLKIIGYADRFSVAPGEAVRFMVSAYDGRPYRSEIVRLVHGDANPEGPGFKAEPVPGTEGGPHPGRLQEIRCGSWARVPARAGVREPESFTAAVMLWPTTPAKGRQGLIGRWDEATGAGWLLEIGEDGRLAARLGGAVVSSGAGLHRWHWYLAALTYDAVAGTLSVVQRPLTAYGLATDAGAASAQASPSQAEADLVMAAIRDGAGRVAHHLNGRLDSPRLVAGAVPPDRLDALFLRPMPADLAAATVAAWDLSRGIETTRVADAGPNGLDGELVNLPTRAVKGWNWDGSEHCWRRKPEHYGAVHFHDDDLYDAGWEEGFRWTVPEGLRSGVYAARVWSGDAEDGTEEDMIPFFVRPPRGPRGKQGRPRVAFLAPTASYIAYANDQNHIEARAAEMVIGRLLAYQPSDVFLYDHPELGKSLYDSHSDGSGVAYSSRLRPILNMRPRYSSWLGASGSGLWQFNADTHLTDWLESHMGVEYDVVTDEDLHEEGLDLLRPYLCVVTGTHPEYHSLRMWDAMKGFLDRGGRLMYLAANGWYWRIAFHGELPGVIEVRRAEDGIRTWAAEPGEYWHSFTGEFGGLWRRQGRPPNVLTGIGFMAQGFDVCSRYRRRPGSYDPRARWIFEGVAGEVFGDHGLVGGGAAGLELDAAKPELGTPPHALVLASSEGHSDLVMLVNEEFGVVPPNLRGSEHPDVRADMVFFETPGGGAVFSTGSIAWCGSLSWNGYDNDVSRITGNVLRRFADPRPFA
jgi:N,N-dimethylformamidase